MIESWIQSECKYKGKVFSVRVGEVSIEGGGGATREIVEHSGGAAAVPVLDDRSVILVRQFRIAIGKETLELPGGRLEPNDSPEQRALRELEEETGYQATSVVPAACFYSSPGFTDERIHIFLAFGLKKVGQNLETGEHLRLVIMPLEDIRQKLSNNEFEDANAIIGLSRLLAYLDHQATNVT